MTTESTSTFHKEMQGHYAQDESALFTRQMLESMSCELNDGFRCEYEQRLDRAVFECPYGRRFGLMDMVFPDGPANPYCPCNTCRAMQQMVGEDMAVWRTKK